MILDSTPNILQLCQKWFWIPLKLFYGHIRNDFGFHSKYFTVMSAMISDDSTQNIYFMVMSQMTLDST